MCFDVCGFMIGNVCAAARRQMPMRSTRLNKGDEINSEPEPPAETVVCSQDPPAATSCYHLSYVVAMATGASLSEWAVS